MSAIITGAYYAAGAVFALVGIILIVSLTIRSINEIKWRRECRKEGADRFETGRTP